MPEGAECLKGERGMAMSERVRHNVLDALRKDAPEGLEVIEESKRSHKYSSEFELMPHCFHLAWSDL